MSIEVNGRLISWGPEHYGGIFPTGEVKVERSYVIDQEQNYVKYHAGEHVKSEELLYLFYIGLDLRDGAPGANNILWLDYIPNARLDKQRGADGDLLPVNAYSAELVNYCGFSKVIGVEPHSEEFLIQYHNAYAEYPTIAALTKIRPHIDGYRNIQYVFPDHGSFVRYKDSLSDVTDEDILVVGKKRQNGTIKSVKLEHGKVKPGYDIVIIDDLCSRGGTFVGAAEVLRANGVTGEIYLLVAHLEQNVRYGKLLGSDSPIKRIFACTKSLGEITHERIIYV
jgi:ribose-phosphate pyrophosphokinase